jgi:transcriptional regulator with GAF, ATPase, and Fis domain
VATRTGRTIAPFTADCIRRLKSYSWPGNVRELQNVIERAVITATDGKLNWDRALPEGELAGTAPADATTSSDDRIRTVKELEQLERANILRALDATKWKVSGANGAAKLLGVNPSTLSSRMKALKIHKPAPR